MLLRLRDRLWARGMLGLILLVAADSADANWEALDAWVPSEVALDESMVTLPDGRRLHLACSGSGEPTVVLDAGLGLDSSVWARVQPDLSAITRTCAYDRAGYGESDPGPLPRNFLRRTSDLMELLDATVEKGPFVLVSAPTEIQPLRQAWSAAGATIAALSTQGEQRMVPNASHVIQFEQPMVVIDAVEDVVNQTRSHGVRGALTP